MARGPRIGPKVRDERAYAAGLRKQILNPMRASARLAITEARQDYYAIGESLRRTRDEIMRGVDGPADAIARQSLENTRANHRRIFTQKMRRHIGVKVDLVDDASFPLTARITENVRLIRTVPQRFFLGMLQGLGELALDAPFDQQFVMDLFAKEFGSAGYNLRRITRDQTSKLIGQLNHHRQAQVGVTHYEWNTANDERVRRSHIANEGLVIAWDDPPSETGHPGDDIMCRCIAVAVIPEAPLADAEGPPAEPPEAAGFGIPERPLRPGDEGYQGLAADRFTTGPFAGVGRRYQLDRYLSEMRDTSRRNPFTHDYQPFRFDELPDDLSPASRAEIATAWRWLSERYPVASAKVRRTSTKMYDNREHTYASTGWPKDIDGYADQAARRDRGFIRDRLAKQHDWTDGDGAEGFVGFNPRYYRSGATPMNDGGNWHVGDIGRTYGTGRDTAKLGQRRTKTVIHEFGHQVGFSAFSRWAAEEIIDQGKRSTRYLEQLSRYEQGLRKTKPRPPKPAAKGYAPGGPSVRFGMNPGKGISSPVAEARFEKMLKANRKALGDGPQTARWPVGPNDEYLPWQWWGDVSRYATQDIHEFTAEAFTAVTLYGDDAPLIARLWVRELNKANAAMELETAAAFGY